jgi:hypothetical protein
MILIIHRLLDNMSNNGGMICLSSYPSRKSRSQKNFFQIKKKQLLIITNFWLIYFILMGFIPLTSNTYSYFNDVEIIKNSIKVADDFCADDKYAIDHEKECKCKDNSGIGNGPEPCDDGEGKTDPDNPKHGNDDDHPKPPKSPDSSATKSDKESAEVENSNTTIQETDKPDDYGNLDYVIKSPNSKSENEDSKSYDTDNQSPNKESDNEDSKNGEMNKHDQ